MPLPYPSLTADAHLAHAARLGARVTGAVPHVVAARHALADGHRAMALASGAQARGDHESARLHANTAALYHSKAHGFDAHTARAHGAVLAEHLNLSAPHLGSRTVAKADAAGRFDALAQYVRGALR